ncbi:phage tail tape measure protein [uncultured Porphyromonas sp.]|uniref:phage tail tape measure protein n=1 Tax=uncultured Porphyromonas sp. TaxID=159274 RepID=UPI002603F6BD|nr:phage tail tape measure protein [uncultured Porphyromonas sp.]
MTSPAMNYLFNIGGDFTVQMESLNKATGEFTAKVSSAQKGLQSFVGLTLQIETLSSGFQRVSESLSGIIAPGVALNTSLTDLQAITGVTGESLRQIEGYARDTAKAFGIDAAGAVESYKLILGQLSPELAKSPVALKAMGDHVATLSKLMGGDATAAAEVLNTAMNQYGVDLSNPIAASEEMARMMNVMAAAGKEGSAELPQIKEALEQAGMAAKGAGVSFEEANAAIQVLDKAGKKGSEGGIALRNVLSTLSQGRFLPREVRKELAQMGIDVARLADKNLSLKERLDMLRPVMQDSALFTRLFGKENANAAMALVGGSEDIAGYTAAIQGTTSAQDQAATVMDGFAERQARIRQKIEDLKISIFNGIGDIALWGSTLGDAAIPIAQLLPLLQFAGGGIKGIYTWIVGGSWRTWVGTLRSAVTWMGSLALKAGQAALKIAILSGRALLSGIAALGSYIASLVTSGAAHVGFALSAELSFATFATAGRAACAAVSTAITSIPIIGWIAGLVALGVYFWQTSAKFRAIVKGLWAAIKEAFTNIWTLAKDVFGGVFDLIKSALSFDGDGIDAALKRVSGALWQVWQRHR